MCITKIFHFVYDLLSPRYCCVCGERLTIDEKSLCDDCLKGLPYTYFHRSPYDNTLARLFWKRISIEKASALFFFFPKSEAANIIYQSKYHHQPEISYNIALFAAKALLENNFFDGIDYLIPIPLTKKRQKERGFNQSKAIAEGISIITHISVFDTAVKRTQFSKSQTHLSKDERFENTADVFKLISAEKIKGKHLLLIDDIITTGATIIECAKALQKAGDVKISVFALGFTKN